MEFEKSRVYTTANANELKIGSKCIFANSLTELKRRIEVEYRGIETLEGIAEEHHTNRFIWRDKYGLYYKNLAYLIESPKEQKVPEYKPFSSVEKAKEIIDKHGGWVKDKTTQEILFVTSYSGLKINQRDNDVIFIGTCWYSLNELYHHFVFADDGSPCGELVKE